MERLDHLLNLIDPANRPDAEAMIRRIQADLAAELEAATHSQNDARLAALNMMEDAVLAKNRLEITQLALDHSADAVFWVERDFTFSYVNDSACQLLGYTREELLKLSVPDIDPNFPAEKMEEAFATMEQSGVLDTESTLIAKDGRIIPVEIHDSIVRIGSRTFICAFIHDITARKQAEQALRESRKNLQITLNSIGDAVISTDTAGRVTLMNPVAEALTGWSQAEATGKPLEDIFRIIHEESRKPLESPVAGVLTSGQVVELANHALLLAKDGREIPIADSGAPITTENGDIIGVVLVFRDQTKERAARKAIERSEAKYHDLFEKSADAFLVIRNGRFFDCNQAAVNMLGFKNKTDLMNTHPSELSPERQPDGQLSREKADELMARVKDEKSIVFEWNHKRADGTVLPVEVSLTSITDNEGGNIIHTTWRDMTARKLAEKKIAFEQNLFKSFMDTLPASVYFKDIEGRFIKVNKAKCLELGRHDYEIIGKSDADFLPEDQTEQSRQDELKVINSQQIIQIEDRSHDRWFHSTKAPWYNANDKLTGIFGISVDITDMKRVQQEFEKSQRLLRDVVDTIPSRVWWKDLDSRFMGCNLHFAHDAGMENPDQLLGKTDYDMCWKDHADHFVSDDRKVIESGQPKLGVQEFQTQADGNIRWIETNKVPLRNNQGRIIGTVGSYADITDRKEAERQIEFEHSLFLAFMETVPAAVYFKNQNGQFVRINQHMADAFGLSKEDLIGKTDFDFYPEEQARKKFEDEQQVMKTCQPIQLEEPHKDRWLMTTKAPLYDETGAITGTFGISIDITEKKLLQEAIEKRILALTRPLEDNQSIAFDELFDLKEIQRIQDEFAAATGVASIVTQIDGTPITQPSNFTHLCSNIIRKTEKGCSNCFKSDAALGRNDPDGPMVQPCLSGGLWDAGVSITVGGKHIANWLIGQVRDEIQTDEHMRAYAKEIGADETKFMDAFYNVPVMSLAHFKEISQALFTLANQLSASAYQNVLQARFIAEEKKNKDELVRLSTAIEQSPETIVITDLSGSIQYINPAFERITGYSAEEAIGKNSRILKSGEHDAAFYSSLWETIRAGRVWNGHLINKRKDGVLYTEEASIAPVRDSSGRITGYVAVKRDITEELSREEMFRQSQKMEAVGQLAGGIAHDFNNILQAILGFSELLLAKLSRETTEYRNTNEIHNAAMRAADLTRQLLTFSRKQPVQRTEVDLNAAVRNMEVLLDVLLGEKIQLQLDLCENLLKTYADYSQITQVIMNLAVNSRDAMPDGGRLSLSTENMILEKQDADTLPDVTAGDFVCLSVTDTGCGMNQETKERLFEPFFTTKEVGKGTGLGLSVLYGIVKQSKGWVHVYSEEGHGTSIKIYLPAAKPAAKKDTAANATCCESILLAEDDVELRAMVVRILETAGYKPVAVATAEEALKLFTAKSGAFDLLFSDIVLPGKSGIELADELRAKNPALPVLLYSGYRDQRERWKDLNSKGYHFTQKPFTVAGLLAAVNGAITEPV